MFEPWIGPNYGSSEFFGLKRVLVLGESHYTHKPEEVGSSPPGLTRYVVETYGLTNTYATFFDRLADALSGGFGGVGASTKRQVWEAVAFFNYVPMLVDGRSGANGGDERRPRAEMFEAGAASFRKHYADLEPEAVVVCGLETWHWLAPHLDGFGPADRDVVYYDDGRAIFARIHHPSYRLFDPGKWNRRTRQLIKYAADPHQCGRRVHYREDERWTWKIP